MSGGTVRTTVDLAPELHADVGRWTIAARSQVGGRVSTAETVRVLLRRLVDDETLSAAVIAALREERQSP